MSSIFNLNFKDVVGAVVSAVIVSVLIYIATLASPVAEFDFAKAIDIAILTAVASLIKSLGTTNEGNFLGAIKVK